MATVDVPEEIDRLLSELSKKTGRTKADILRELLDSISDSGEVDEVDKMLNIFSKEVGGEGEFSKMMKDIALAKVYMKMLDGGDNWAKVLQPILMINLIKQMTRPDPYEMLLLEKISKGKDDELKRLLDEYRKSEEDKWKMIQSMLLTAKNEEEKKALLEKIEELNKRIESKEREKEKEELMNTLSQFSKQVAEALKTVNDRISYLENALIHANNKNDILSQIQQLKQLRENLKEIADALGLVEKKKEIPVSTQGKMDWGRAVYELIRDGMDKVAEIVKVMKQSPPPMKQPQEFNPENFHNSQQEQLIQDEIKKTEEVMQEIQEKMNEVKEQVEETPKEEIKTEEQTKVEERKEEEVNNVESLGTQEVNKEEETNNEMDIITDDNVKIPDYPFMTLGELKQKTGINDLYIKNGQVCYKKNGIEYQLSDAQLEEFENQILAEKLQRGELDYKVEYNSVNELLQDEDTLQSAYMFAKEGTKIKLADGTDVTDIVLQEGEKRGYKTLEELAKEHGGGKTEEKS